MLSCRTLPCRIVSRSQPPLAVLPATGTNGVRDISLFISHHRFLHSQNPNPCCSFRSYRGQHHILFHSSLLHSSQSLQRPHSCLHYLFCIMTYHARRFFFPSDPPSEEGSPGEVRSRCPSAASLATGPAGLPQRGVSARFRKVNLLALRRANGRDSGEPAAHRAGAAGSASLPTCLHEQESRSPAGARPGAALQQAPAKVGTGNAAAGSKVPPIPSPPRPSRRRSPIPSPALPLKGRELTTRRSGPLLQPIAYNRALWLHRIPA